MERRTLWQRGGILLADQHTRELKRALLLVLLLLSMPIVVAQQRQLTGRVVKISDGDTFTLLCDNKTVRVRLYGIDSPESKQPYAQKAKAYLADLVSVNPVRVWVANTDRYGRVIGKVSTSRTQDVSLQMLKAGLAWHYSHFDKTAAYREAEQAARRQKIGLWQDPKPVNPYVYRKSRKNSAKKKSKKRGAIALFAAPYGSTGHLWG